MITGRISGRVFKGLAVRVLLLLSFAMLPIGLIALTQTWQISEQSNTKAELSLIAVTELASSAEQRVLQEAFSAAKALSSVVRLRRNAAAECSDILREYKVASGVYSLVGFTGINGLMSCSSSDEIYDLSKNERFLKAIKSKSQRAIAVANPSISKRPVTVVYIPVYEDQVLLGIMAISIPYETFQKVNEPELQFLPLAIMTFNRDGEILTTEQVFEDVKNETPKGLSLASLANSERQVLYNQNQLGQDRVYAVLPIVPETVFALSVWPTDTPFLQAGLSTRLSALMPIIMWVASLVVAFWALHNLAITHIRKLGQQMRRFALNRTMPRDRLSPGVPSELIDMDHAFFDMAESIMRDEAFQEDGMRQKNILLKEIHHRVKNNLQLISSIMNMQIRQAKSEDEQLALRRLQERILGLATVHENLYQNDDIVSIDASVLLRETVNQLLSVGLGPGSDVTIDQHYEKIILDPDNAAPLTLLVSEVMTNALKYVTAQDGAARWIDIDLSYQSADVAKLEIKNSISATPIQSGTGLGSNLIKAFTLQLNGQCSVDQFEGTYRLLLTFPVPKQSNPTLDY